MFSLSKVTCITNNAEIYFLFKILSSMGGKMTTQPGNVYSNFTSPMECVLSCTTTRGCVSVFFLEDALCQGHAQVFETNSLSLVSKPGAVYYVLKNHAGL
jgi:hypothetical protein